MGPPAARPGRREREPECATESLMPPGIVRVHRGAARQLRFRAFAGPEEYRGRRIATEYVQRPFDSIPYRTGWQDHPRIRDRRPTGKDQGGTAAGRLPASLRRTCGSKRSGRDRHHPPRGQNPPRGQSERVGTPRSSWFQSRASSLTRRDPGDSKTDHPRHEQSPRRHSNPRKRFPRVRP